MWIFFSVSLEYNTNVSINGKAQFWHLCVSHLMLIIFVWRFGITVIEVGGVHPTFPSPHILHVSVVIQVCIVPDSVLIWFFCINESWDRGYHTTHYRPGFKHPQMRVRPCLLRAHPPVVVLEHGAGQLYGAAGIVILKIPQ